MSTAATNSLRYSSFELPEVAIGRGASTAFVVIAAILIVIAFEAPITESWKRSMLEHYDNPEAAAATLSQGSMARQIALGGLGMFGLASLVWPGGRAVRVGGALGFFCVAYLAWCLASCLWSDDFGISVRRLAALGCEIAAGAAIAKRCTARQLVWIVLACTFSWLVMGILAEISLGTFRPWQSVYRFAGIFHPNGMGINCAVLAMAALYLASGKQRAGRWLFALAGIAFLFLLLTGSRGALGALIIAVAAIWVVVAFKSRLFYSAVAIALAAGCLSIGIGLSWLNVSSDAVSMGRQNDEASTLTGRIPLWTELVESYISQSPLIGHGFAAFWTEQRITDISRSQTWSVASSHSAYVDMLLNVGAIGMFLCLAAMGIAFVKGSRLEALYPKSGYGFVAQIIIFSLAGGALETTIGITTFLSFFGICGVCFLLFDDAKLDARLPQNVDAPTASPYWASSVASR